MNKLIISCLTVICLETVLISLLTIVARVGHFGKDIAADL